VQVFFSYHNGDPADIRNQSDIGGGALYDIGCYGIVSGRFLFEAEPRRAVALFDRDAAFRTDRTTSALVDFGQGRQLSFTVSTQCVPYQRVQICGTRGRIEIEIPFNAAQGEATRIITDDGSALDGSSIATELIPPCDQYMLESEAFSRAVRGEIPLPYGLEDALANMRIIDALFRSEKSGRFEEV
jgi:predicted dehydrogenase